MPRLSRRHFLASGMGLAACGLSAAAKGVSARMRVIVDNDFGGDPDGLFQLAHFMLSKSVDVPLVVGSNYKDFGPADLNPRKGQTSAEKAKELSAYMTQSRVPRIVAGSDRPLASGTIHSAATAEIIREAMREDISSPLFYAAAGSLTEIALAWKQEPRIGRRLKIAWIGGQEYPDLAAPPPGPNEAEYNFSIDRKAAQIIFNESNIEVWQVPRNVFRQMLFSFSELNELARESSLARYLQQQVLETSHKLSENLPFIFSEGETFGLGDCALVTLTALQSAFQPDTSSSNFSLRPTPRLNEDGSYVPRSNSRLMRVYTSIDSGLTFRDMASKFREQERRKKRA